MLRIGTRLWKFVSTPGRLFFGKEEHLSLVDESTGQISVSDTLTIERQMEVVAETAVGIYRAEMQASEQRRTEYLRSAGYDFTIPSAGPLRGIPMLRDVKWTAEHAQGHAAEVHPPRLRSA